MRKFMILLIFAGLFSCTSYVELDQEEYNPKIVVDGWIESGNYANVFLTFSSPFLTSYDSASIRATFINSAKITLTSSKGDSEILTLHRQDNYFPPFVYKSSKIKGEVGVTYNLKIESMGNILTASTSIPDIPDIKGLEMETVTDSSGILKVGLQPCGTEDEFLIMMIKSSMAKDVNFHPARIPVWWSPQSSDYVLLKVYRSHETNMYFLNPEDDVYKNWPDYQFALKDTVSVKVGRIDHESYRVMISIFSDQSIQENPFAFNSSGIKTNIVGGIGRWTGIGLAPLQIYKGK
jgi:hypothetical protein